MSTLKYHTTASLKHYSSHVIIAANISKNSPQRQARTANKQNASPCKETLSPLVFRATQRNLSSSPLMLGTAQLSVDHHAYSKLYLFSRLHSHNKLQEDIRAQFPRYTLVARLTTFPSLCSCPQHGPKPPVQYWQLAPAQPDGSNRNKSKLELEHTSPR